MLNAEDKKRLVDALRNQRDQISILLSNPERDEANLHHLLAGILRSMLCDADWPTLLCMAREQNIDLRVWGPFPAGDINSPPPSFAFNALIASSEPERFGFEMGAAEYLDAPIGAVVVGMEGPRWYSPRQLIKWVANKEGYAHFDPKVPATLESVKNVLAPTEARVSIERSSGSIELKATDALIVRMALIQISEWARDCANQVIATFS
jgi:hypothetical protein